MPAPIRGRAIAHIGRLVEDNAEALARLVTAEIGKPYGEALGEVREIVDTCDFFLGEGRRLYGQTVPSEMPDKQLFTFRKPVGAVAVITAGNFPVAVPAWYIVPALLAGNSIVWKPAEYSAVASAAFHEIFVRGGGLPDGVFNIVHADGPATFAGLEQSLDAGLIDKVGFTGSSAVGQEIGALTGRHLQTACLELGGKNPLVVTPSAELDLAVEGALFSGFGTGGQRCTSLGTVIVHESVHDEFLAKLNAAVAAAKVGDPTQDVLMGPMLDAKFAERYEEFLDWIEPHHKAQSATGRITADNGRDGFVGDPAAGLFYHPVVVDGVRPGDRLFMEETFGPIIGITTYRTLDEAIDLANAPGYGLSSSIYTTDPKDAFTFRGQDRRRHGVDQQLHLRRGGAPAVRRQRQVRQRIPAVRDLGPRSVHPLAVGQLGLLGPAAEGPDGHRRTDPRHHLPPLTRTARCIPCDRFTRKALGDLSASVIARARRESDKSAEEGWWRVFEAQATSRHLDFVARELQQQGAGVLHDRLGRS